MHVLSNLSVQFANNPGFIKNHVMRKYRVNPSLSQQNIRGHDGYNHLASTAFEKPISNQVIRS